MTTTQATSPAGLQARMRTELTARLAAHRQRLDRDAACTGCSLAVYAIPGETANREERPGAGAPRPNTTTPRRQPVHVIRRDPPGDFGRAFTQPPLNQLATPDGPTDNAHAA
jgi:hypothetical protein